MKYNENIIMNKFKVINTGMTYNKDFQLLNKYIILLDN